MLPDNFAKCIAKIILCLKLQVTTFDEDMIHLYFAMFLNSGVCVWGGGGGGLPLSNSHIPLYITASF